VGSYPQSNNYGNDAIPPIYYEQHPLPGGIPVAQSTNSSNYVPNYTMHKPLMLSSNNPSLCYERVELNPFSNEQNSANYVSHGVSSPTEITLDNYPRHQLPNTNTCNALSSSNYDRVELKTKQFSSQF
jgi:hypothetical protein